MKKHIYFIAAIIIGCALQACTLKKGEHIYENDKERMLWLDVDNTLDDHIDMALAGFKGLCYETADGDERILLENTLFERHLFRSLGDKWGITFYETTYYVALDRDIEGEVSAITVTRKSFGQSETQPLFDSCKMVYKGEDSWEIEIKGRCRANEYESTYKEGTATLDLYVIEALKMYPFAIDITGKGNYEVLRQYDESDTLGVEWTLHEGYVDTRRYASLDTFKYTIKGGIKSKDKTEFEAYRNQSNGDIVINTGK